MVTHQALQELVPLGFGIARCRGVGNSRKYGESWTKMGCAYTDIEPLPVTHAETASANRVLSESRETDKIRYSWKNGGARPHEMSRCWRPPISSSRLNEVNTHRGKKISWETSHVC